MPSSSVLQFSAWPRTRIAQGALRMWDAGGDARTSKEHLRWGAQASGYFKVPRQRGLCEDSPLSLKQESRPSHGSRRISLMTLQAGKNTECPFQLFSSNRFYSYWKSFLLNCSFISMSRMDYGFQRTTAGQTMCLQRTRYLPQSTPFLLGYLILPPPGSVLSLPASYFTACGL